MSYRLAGLITLLAAAPVYSATAATCGTTTATSSPAEVVQAQVDAYNAHDIEAFVACYAEDARVIDLSGKRPEVKGQAALKQTFAFLGKVPKNFGVDIVKRVVDGPVVIDLEHLHGLPPGKHAPDSLAVYEVRNGKIVKLWFPPST
ncbi:nuclear transport factor 2 family protein [Oleiagrimonas soli]|uniref:SnoaL-like domain-containing protein n=1 Tax=Oleiagrimonas soli TaxID=1543381 RepID=A0A099CVW3_9GAMM|nr:nuclear transport factor 2 family protein [Oleiagrimonas soli]KGI78063.1 hypothetical protein LF63_0106750 [Oleiagrimonas soli]MBB6183530.1 hypothetical protein [Oleiagrimonas soli]